MITVFSIALTFTCVALTVGFLGTLRGIAEVRLRLAGAGNTQFRLDAGTGLPEPLLAALADPRALGVLIFLSEDCGACWQLVDELPNLQLDGAPVTVCLIHADTGKMRDKLGPGFNVVEADVAAQAARHLRIDSTPIVVVHRDGYVVGSAHGSSAESIGTLQRLWSASAMPEGFRPYQPDQLLAKRGQPAVVRDPLHSEGGSQS